MKSSTRSRLIAVLIAAVAFGAGWLLRDRRAASDEALRDRIDVLSGTFGRVAADRFVLVMLEKQRTEQLAAHLTKRMSDELTIARKNLSELPGSTSSMVERYPWTGMLLPNWASEFRRSSDYLTRHGGYQEAVTDAQWLAAQVDEQDGS